MAFPPYLRPLPVLLAALLLALGSPAAGAVHSELATLPPPADPERPEAWIAHRAALSRMGDGLVVWESNRTGRWRIWAIGLGGEGLRQLTPDEAGRDHIAPHLSPDGRHVAYLSVAAPHTDFRRTKEGGELRLVPAGATKTLGRVLVGGARPYWQNRAVVWIDAERLVYIGRDEATRLLDLRTGSDEMISEPRTKVGMLVNATFTYATTGRPSFSTYHEADHSIARRRKLPGCQPYFSHDGRYGFWVAGAGGPIRKIDLETRRADAILEKHSRWLPEGHGYVYYPMTSRNQRLIAFGASRDEHGHFEADFDIFVAPIDPDSLEVIGTAVRLTFDPAQDRFPDVFLAGEELGRRRGEVPLRVRLAIPPEGPGAAPWTFTFGDDSQGSGAPEHVYDEPGTYPVTARRGDEVLRGVVEVLPGGPPKPQRVEVPPGRRRIHVVFDEPVDAGDAEVRLASGRAVDSFRVENDPHVLVVRLAQPLEANDQLQVSGIRDRARPPRAMAPAALDVAVGEWPRHDGGLVFLYETAEAENLAPDPATGHPRASEVEPHGDARYDAHGALLLAGGSFQADESLAGVAAALADAGSFTLELTFQRSKPARAEDAYLVSLGAAPDAVLLALVQVGPGLRARIATAAGPREVDLGKLRRGKRSQHVMISFAEGELRAYRDGEPAAHEKLDVDLDAWRPRPLELRVGADLAGQRAWVGTIEGVALYARRFSPAEAVAHADAYLDRIAQRDPVPRYKVRARLASASAFPTLAEIAPYREALVLYEYEVLKGGDLPPERVRVAHWAILDGKAQAIREVRVGERRELVLEPFARHRVAASMYLSDTLDQDVEVPLYVDVAS